MHVFSQPDDDETPGGVPGVESLEGYPMEYLYSGGFRQIVVCGGGSSLIFHLAGGGAAARA